MKRYWIALIALAAYGQTPTESPEHRHARQNYEAAEQQRDSLTRQIELDEAKTKELTTEVLASVCDSDKGKEQYRACMAKARANKAMRDELDAHIEQLKMKRSEMIDLLPDLAERLEYADDCMAVFRKTIDKKTSDLTVRENSQIKACMTMDLYPPDH